MSPKRLLCAAALCLCFTGAAALAQTNAPSMAPAPAATPEPTPSMAPSMAPAAEPADEPAPETSAPAAPAPAPMAPATPPTKAAATPPAAPMTGPVRNVVLVHGAFVDGSSWNGVVAKLQQKGYHVSSVQNPLTSLADDVAATRRVLARQNGPTILVGHSWGGVVITEAGANAPNVAGLVYIAAIAPDLHESAMDLMKRAAPMPAGDGIMEDSKRLPLARPHEIPRRLRCGRPRESDARAGHRAGADRRERFRRNGQPGRMEGKTVVVRAHDA